MKNLLKILILISFYQLNAQNVAINPNGSNAHQSAILHVQDTARGLLIPRMTTVQRLGIVNPAAGLIVLDMDTKHLWVHYPAMGGWRALLTDFDSIDDADADSSNEFQTITKNSNIVILSNGGGSFIDQVNDADPNSSNEIQNLSVSGDQLTIDGIGGNTVTIPVPTLIEDADQNSKVEVLEVAGEDEIRMHLEGEMLMKFQKSSQDLLLVEPDSKEENTFYGISAGFNTDAINSSAGAGNTFIGFDAGLLNTVGSSNVGVGVRTLRGNNAGGKNTALGYEALGGGGTGNRNTAIGYHSLFSAIPAATDNVAVGQEALHDNSGNENTAVGNYALQFNSIGRRNTAIGTKALNINGVSENNSAVGYCSMSSNFSGFSNSALGNYSLSSNISGDNNLALGYQALEKNEQGSQNVSVGWVAGKSGTNSDKNTYVGASSGWQNLLSNNTFLGHLSGGGGERISGSVLIGYSAGANVDSIDNQLYIENSISNNPLIWGDFAADSLLINGSMQVGKDQGSLTVGTDIGSSISIGTYVLENDGVSGIRFSGNVRPIIDSTYNLGGANFRWKKMFAAEGFFQTSDVRAKKNIQALSYGLQDLLDLRAVQYQLKGSNQDVQLGLIAQETLEVIPEVVHHSSESELLGMNYLELIPVLINAIQDLNEKHEETIERLEKKIEALNR